MSPKLPLPRGWKRRVRSSVLHILTLGRYSLPAPGCAPCSPFSRWYQPTRFDDQRAVSQASRIDKPVHRELAVPSRTDSIRIGAIPGLLGGSCGRPD